MFDILRIVKFAKFRLFLLWDFMCMSWDESCWLYCTMMLMTLMLGLVKLTCVI